MPEAIAEVLSWEQPRLLHGEFSLLRGKETVGSLTFRSAWGTLATGRLGAAEWTFKRLGVFRTRITVREAGSDQEVATFHPSTWTGGGILQLGSGREFKLDISCWQTRLDLLASTGQLLLRYRPKGVFRQGAEMDVVAGLREVEEFPWLMLFGWYLAVLLHRDSSAAAV